MSTATPAAFSASAEPGATPASRGSWLRTLVTLLIGFILGALTVAGAAIWYLADGEPDFYTRALKETPPAERRANAEAFEERTVELARELEYGDDWEQRFTQAEVNGWLAEEFPNRYGDQIPDEVSDPRVDLTRPGLVRLGFRLSNAQFDGVVSLAVRPEVLGPNRVALHVEGLMAGLFPLDPVSFAPQVSQFLDQYRIEHDWRLPGDADKTDVAEDDASQSAADANDEAPVLIVAFSPRRANRAVLEEVEIEAGAVRVSG
ncbi:MAG: hypothetical protein AAF907_07405, partial [Planctomycetota bacterium]